MRFSFFLAEAVTTAARADTMSHSVSHSCILKHTSFSHNWDDIEFRQRFVPIDGFTTALAASLNQCGGILRRLMYRGQIQVERALQEIQARAFERLLRLLDVITHRFQGGDVTVGSQDPVKVEYRESRRVRGERLLGGCQPCAAHSFTHRLQARTISYD